MRNKNSNWPFLTLLTVLNAALLCMTVATYLITNNLYLFLTQAAVALVLVGFTLWRVATSRRGMFRFLSKVASQLSTRASETLASLPMPVLLLDEQDHIIWYNDLLRTRMLRGKDVYGLRGESILGEAISASLTHVNTAQLQYEAHEYTVYQSAFTDQRCRYRVLFFADDTELKEIRERYFRSRPVVMIAAIDSINEFSTNIAESELAAMYGAVEKEIETFSVSVQALMRKLSSGRYMLILEEKNMQTALNDRFSLLDRVRELTFAGEKGNLTLSIGVGRDGETVAGCDTRARQALDMAFGRGGDQVAIMNKDGYEFFGGVSKGIEKRTKVRTRVIASAIREFIEASDNVLIMGHKYADLDSLGAAYALWSIVNNLGKKAKIVMSRTATLAGPLLERIDLRAQQDGEEIVVEAQEAMTVLNKRTLLMIVDTHRPSVVESEELYRAATTVIVVDHHRKTVDYIENAAVFYHEPYSSSACEMVAELTQYIGQDLIGREEAEGLLSGIMLDTKNYVLKTGVRTFEASAYLRSLGADPVTVKKMFSGTMELYQQKAELVASAEIYLNCAISGNDLPAGVSRIAAAQAADELLSIDGVSASFVIYRAGNRMSISARSFGEINVQLIMESLGGGGHQTMAATQLDGSDYSDAKRRLMEAILTYRKGVQK